MAKEPNVQQAPSGSDTSNEVLKVLLELLGQAKEARQTQELSKEAVQAVTTYRLLCTDLAVARFAVDGTPNKLPPARGV